MEYVAWALSVIAALFIGGFLKSYMSKKGENLATKEDIAELTRITKEIEHRISTKTWSREIRKETAFDAMRKLARLQSCMSKVGVAFMTIDGTNEQERDEAVSHVMEAHRDLEQATMIVEISCGTEIAEIFSQLLQTTVEFMSQVTVQRQPRALELLIECNTKTKELATMIRENLGIELGS